MPFPRPDEASKAFFESVLPDDPRVQVRPMFGNIAGFVNGNMFTGLFGNAMFVRLLEADRAELLKEQGAATLEVMAGRPMKEYVSLPGAWRDDPDRARSWVERSLGWAARLPVKKKIGRKRKGRS